MISKLCSLSGGLGLALFERHLIGGIHRLSSTAAAPKPPFIVEEYLAASCGFSPDEASKAAKRLAYLKSPQKPDSVLGFLRSHGFDETQIRKLVSEFPRLLRFKLDKTLVPKFQALQDLGFSGSDLIHIIVAQPTILNLGLNHTLLPKIEFWRGLLGSNVHLMDLFKKNSWFIGSSVNKTVMPNVSLLRECGVLDERVAAMVRREPGFILRRPSEFRAQVERVEGLGVPRGSGMFLWALWAVHHIREARFNAKLELMRSSGWSEHEFLSAFRRSPPFVLHSEKKLQDKMDFLVNEAGCLPSFVAHHPRLLMLSLERRLIPRYRLLQALKSSGLHRGQYNLFTIMNISEKLFMEKYVLRHKDKIPHLLEMYTAGFHN